MALLALPDLWSHLGDDGYAVAAEAAHAAHSTLDRMLVLDLPESANLSTAAAVKTAKKLADAVPAPAARAAAVYHPWIKVCLPTPS